MMIKMLIVDDELIIRKGISMSIDWEEQGVEIVGEAANGKEAIEKLETLKPDILITDIRMPEMNGLELCRYIYEKNFDIKMIVLTGYDDFEYAKQAITYKVNDFLLKPVGAEKLIEAVAKIIKEINQERIKLEEEKLYKNLVSSNINIMQKKFINNVLKNELTIEDDIINRGQQIKVDLSGPSYQVFVCEIDDYRKLKRKYSKLEIKEITQKTIDDLKAFMNQDILNIRLEEIENEKIIFEGIINIKADCNHIENNFWEFIDTIKIRSGISLTVGLGRVYQEINKINCSYIEAKAALMNKIYVGKSKVINAKEQISRTLDEKYIGENVDIQSAIINSVKEKDEQNLKLNIKRLYYNLTSREVSFESVKLLIMKIMMKVINLNIVEDGNIELIYTSFIKELDYCEIIKDMMIILEKSLINLIETSQINNCKSIIDIAISYIEKNYNEAITLEQLSKITFVTPNYISRIFKEETGKNFKEYLNEYRVNKAKQFLNDNVYKSYEIAEKVGYKDYKYFSTIFKKYTGLSPSKYKKNK